MGRDGRKRSGERVGGREGGEGRAERLGGIYPEAERRDGKFGGIFGEICIQDSDRESPDRVVQKGRSDIRIL